MSVIATSNVDRMGDNLKERYNGKYTEMVDKEEDMDGPMKGELEPVDLSLKVRDVAVQTEVAPGDLAWRENLSKVMSHFIYNQLVAQQNHKQGLDSLKDLDVSVPKIESILKELDRKIKENPDLCLFGPTTKSIKTEESSGKLWIEGKKDTEGREAQTNQGGLTSVDYGVKKEELSSSQYVLTSSNDVVTRQNVSVIDDKFKNPLGDLKEGVKNSPNNDFASSAFSQFSPSRWRPYEEMPYVHQIARSPSENLPSYFNPLYFKGLPFHQNCSSSFQSSIHQNSNSSFQSSILPFQNATLSTCQSSIAPQENRISISTEDSASSLPTGRILHSDLQSSTRNSDIKSHLMDRMTSPLEILRRSAEREMTGRMGKMKRRHSLFEIERRQREADIKKITEQDETMRNPREHQIIRLQQSGIIERLPLNGREYKTHGWPLHNLGKNLDENEMVKRSRKDEIMRLGEKEVLSCPEESLVRWQGNNNKDMPRMKTDVEMFQNSRTDEMATISRGDEEVTRLGADEREKWTMIPRENEMTRRLSVDSMISGKAGKSEKLVQDFLIPLSLSEIIESSMDDFNEFLCNRNLTEDQVSVCRDLRRRGKNKIAAQNCRKRKVEQVKLLETEVETMRKRKEVLLMERVALQGERGQWEQKITRLEENILNKLEKTPGQWRIRVEEGRMDFVKCQEEKKGVEKIHQVKNEKLTRKL